MDTYNGVCGMKCKVRQLILKPLLEKSTLSTHRKVQNFQVQVQKLQMQRVESSKVKILRSRKVLPSQICLCYSLISISSFSIVKLLHCRSGRVAYNGQSLLLCWYFIMSSPEPQPIEKLMMKMTTKADRIPSAGYELIAI